ncbi:hypothetical protein G9C85_17310 [Halorubellus sp. JP-L1]|uniref:DUF5789 family protein n=1 Tax=Halorubellus sp. JP-L1 TaxID=2715753 RepID=UPI00140B6659|nr:hypothetical protein [Halorubellus sp. JP-L1]NHN43378.1 hypothetical protein [Halorubellus sp. JP-L1]
MADDKQGREKQADDADRRQRERAIRTALERVDEPEPPVDPAELAGFEVELESVEFPATGSDVVAAVGDREIESADGTYTVEELVPDADVETFDSPEAVRERVQRPTVAGAMKRVVEAAKTLPNQEFPNSQREGYERTFRALEDVDADDDDEGIRTIADWIVERIDEKEKLPGSRDVRREAAKFTRRNGYPVRNDEWLGV